MKNYFVSSFFWSTLSKILNAVFGFITVPLLLGYFGKADYGLLSIATACNGCMHLMDLGMNTGAVRFFSSWEAEGKRELIQKVSNTNTTFYLIVSAVNIVGLLVLAWFGENLFSIQHDQFPKLRTCFYILALFSSITWINSAYTQLLTAYKQIAFTMKVNCVLTLLRIALVVVVLIGKLSLIEYFFVLTVLVAVAIIPNAIKCKCDGLLNTLKPATYWKEFGIVLSFSLSIFALSLFQVLATQSRPIVLSLFAENGAESVADFRIVEVIPQFIIMVCGTLTSIFLPKSSEMVVKSNNAEIQNYVNIWTTRTTILVCFLCFPFIIAAEEILSAYVGSEEAYLAKWLQLWCFFLIIQMHSTPAFSFILAKGKTRVLVIATAVASVVSILVNIFLCKSVPVGSAVIGYAVYMTCLIGVYYIYIYKYYINLNRMSVVKSFILPFIVALLATIVPLNFTFGDFAFFSLDRMNFISVFVLKSFMWIIPFIALLLLFRIVKLSELKEILK